MKIKLFMLVVGSNGNVTLGDNSVKMKVAEEVSDGAFFMGSDGKEITEVPDNENTEVIAVSPMEAGTEYTPVVTLTETGKNAGGSGGGCNAVNVFAPLLFLSSLIFLKRR